jgi:hypothetical protein
MEETKKQTPEIYATIKAIENGMLILETPDQQLIRWPLNKLPQSVNIGNTISIKLESNDQTSIKQSAVNLKNPVEDPENLRHRLLEELIN